MKHVIILGAALLAGACSFGPKEAPPPARSGPCYTVDLFDKYRIKKPGAGVNAEMAALLGEWGNGAWDGEWCHDLYVLEVRKDGVAKVIETFGPSQNWGRRAAAFRRTGSVSRDGVLTLTAGNVVSKYRVRNGQLHGERREGRQAKPFRIVLNHDGVYSPIRERLRRR